MFGLLKFLFYSCVAVVVGVVIGTVPFGGRTLAERISSVYQTAPAASAAAVRKAVSPSAPKAAARAAPRPKVAAATAPVPGVGAPRGPITAGAANTPDAHTESDKVALDKLIATKVKAPR